MTDLVTVSFVPLTRLGSYGGEPLSNSILQLEHQRCDMRASFPQPVYYRNKKLCYTTACMHNSFTIPCHACAVGSHNSRIFLHYDPWVVCLIWGALARVD